MLSRGQQDHNAKDTADTDTTCPLCKAVKVLNREVVNEQTRNMWLLQTQLPCLPPTPQKARDWVKKRNKTSGTP